MFKHILVAVDGSDHSDRATACAADLAAKCGARLTLLHVMTHAGSNRVPDGLRDLARMEDIQVTEADMLSSVADAILRRAEDISHEHGAATLETAIEEGDPAHAIVEYCKSHDVDLIVLGRRGLGGLAGLLMGSVSHKVAHLADCACMTVV